MYRLLLGSCAAALVDLWLQRGAIAENDARAAPYYLAAVRIQPDHPGANHKLIHLYKAIGRPLLG